MKNMELYNFNTIVKDYFTRLIGHKPYRHAKCVIHVFYFATLHMKLFFSP